MKRVSDVLIKNVIATKKYIGIKKGDVPKVSRVPVIRLLEFL